jgi:GntR family transcriptional regulator, transcriptional repressor for pyruvate dehydrogenase complex
MGVTSIAALRPLERSRLYEDLGERLGQFARESKMAPGDRFPPERELAHQLRVSRTSVRQAMVVLQAQGFVDVRHGEGIFLRRMRGFGESLPKLLERRRRLPEVLEAREALEVKLAELAATRRTRDDLTAMHAALRTMEKEIRTKGLGTDGDAAFHHAIASAARNQVLLHLIDAMADAIKETRVESLSEPGRPPRSLEAHRRILRAIEAGEPRGAAQEMRKHLRQVADVSLLRWQPDALTHD